MADFDLPASSEVPFSVPVPGGELCGEWIAGTRPIVFVHGFGGDRQSWDGIWTALSSSQARLRYDLRGYGSSTATPGVEFHHKHDLAKLLDGLDLKEVDLVGSSMGGGIALSAALDDPDRIRNLVLISPALLGWEWSDEWLAIWNHTVTAAQRGDIEEAKRRWHRHPMFAPARAGAGADALAASLARFSGRQFVQDDQLPVSPDLDRLPNLAVPTLLLSGEADFADFRLMADLIAGSSEQVTRINFPGRGHMLHMETPVDCAAAIMDFI